MVSCKLIGRLGNQAFQLAAAIAHAARHGYEFMPPPATEHEGIWPYYFEHLRSYGSMRGLLPYTEPSFSYTPMPARDNIRLSGYFQSYKYFEGYEKQVTETLFPDLGRTRINMVAMHIRRGDYLQHADKHPVLPLDYYMKAMEYFPGERFLIFSDDINWCKTIFTGPAYEFAQWSPMEDLMMMARCKGVITANSSFSWWGGILCGGKVVMPKQWFGPGNGHLDTKDIYLPNAIVI